METATISKAVIKLDINFIFRFTGTALRDKTVSYYWSASSLSQENKKTFLPATLNPYVYLFLDSEL